MANPNVYVAAPLFSVWERERNERFGRVLQKAGYNPLLPQEINAPTLEDGKLDMQVVFSECVRLLDEADAVVAFCEGPDVDSGTAWELGYATAKGISSLCVRTDLRRAEGGSPANIMLCLGATEVLDMPSYHGKPQDINAAIIKALGGIVYGDTV
ncbi:MAG TPA: nucleoside 2-deoxyribosyltransferase [Candidatus Saccharimonadales bacterium]|nr:nucleoside 2-deoxyribosyltransferase [Candidatus Saccharimonadales bacterium]